jgi:signal peptidase I
MLWALAILSLIGFVLYLTVFDAWTVPGDDPTFVASIAPNLYEGDNLLLLKSSELKPGHLVRCADPDAPARFVVGRIVAQGGDKVALDEVVVVNGKRNPSPHGCTDGQRVMRHPVTGQDVKLTCAVEDTNGNEHEALRDMEHPLGEMRSVVESGKIYIVSDNRHIHLDSRDFGQVSPSTCQHIVYRLWGTTYFDASRRFTFLW